MKLKELLEKKLRKISNDNLELSPARKGGLRKVKGGYEINGQ